MKAFASITGPLAATLVAVVFLSACQSDGPPLRAIQVTRQDQLIGGPSAKGKLGDFLIENNRIRAIVGNTGPGWAGGIFGGTLLDVDRHRWRGEFRDGKGWDSFAESFPLANLLVVNPAQPKSVLKFEKDGFKIESTVSAVSVLKDGSDGEAVIRVEGHSAYMFDVLKFLNRDFLLSFLKDLSFDFGGATLDYDAILDLVDGLIGVNVLGLLNRLQITFNFTTDFILRQDESFLTMRTTVELAPPSEKELARCKPVQCDLDCPDGFAVEEITEAVPGRGTPDKYVCPVCKCGESVDSMPTFNESRDFFKVLLGDLDVWKDPSWKGGIVAGDFLFFGSECGIFSPGLGFDYDRKIFENMWQGLGTLGSPLVYDWVAGIADNVSYAWTSINPNQKTGFDCDEYRFAIVRMDPEKEGQVVQNLIDNMGWAEGNAKAAGRQAVVDHKAITLASFPMDAAKPGANATEEQRRKAFADWIEAKLAGADADALRTQLGDGAELGIIPKHSCMPAKVLIPLFTTSATAVLTHFSEDDKFTKEGTSLVDNKRSYTFERYMAVGDGDVGSVLETIYELRDTPHGFLVGNVYEEGSLNPITHADVFVLKDPRKDDSVPLPTTFREYQDMAMEAWGTYGPFAFMQTDLGLDTTLDGDFHGPLEEGRYLLLAYTLDRGPSEIVPVTVVKDETVRVNFVLPRWGEVEYRVEDDAGYALPSRLSFIPLDSFGFRHGWEGENEPPLGDPRYDHGIMKLEHSVTGTGVVRLPPGHYDIIVSRGLEYGVETIRDFAVKAGQTDTLHATLPREVDTTGYVAGDFHVHARNSVDSGLPIDLRVKAAVTEGLEFVSSSDHDHLTDYTPYIKEMGLERYLSSQVGVETSPLEYGHFNGYPQVYDDTQQAVHDPPQWVGMTLAQAWEEMKKRMLGGEDSFVLQVNHSRDGFQGYFSQLGMLSYDLERATPGMEMCNATLAEAPCNFDAMEILNGKHAEYVNTPTVWEAQSYQRCYDEIVEARDPALFPLGDGDGTKAVCGWLQVIPDMTTCEKAVKPAGGPLLNEADAAARVLWDHCRWHQAFRERFASCVDSDDKPIELMDCKRIALEALKFLMARYMIERSPDENRAYFATTRATDVGCDLAKAMMGCETAPDAGGDLPAGCGGPEECVCETCVCDAHPECCKTVADGGTGWDQDCADACRTECHGCEMRPCTDRNQLFDDFLAFVSAGFDVTGMANSDSHTILNQIGMPRTYVEADRDSPIGLDAADVDRNIKSGRTVMSSGPYIDFTIVADGGAAVAGVGDTLDASKFKKLQARIRVQTASWFKVDRVEIYRNTELWKVFYPDRPKEDIVDFDQTVDLDPKSDTVYVVTAYGMNDADLLSPVYKRTPYGHILFSTILALGADQILQSFSDLLALVGPVLGDIDDLLGALTLPDSYPVMPWAATNPIRVDVDGDSFLPVNARNARKEDGRWVWDLPLFCSQPCAPAPDANGDTKSTCGLNQTCVTQDDGTGKCMIPIPEACVGLQPVGKPVM